MLEKCRKATASREIQREAFRLAYCCVFAFELPFAAVKVLGLYEAELNYRHVEDLAPGKDPSLYHICDFLMKGLPLHDPRAKGTVGATADEDAFFDELAHTPDYLRNTRYERWQRFLSLGRSTKDLLRRLPFGIGDVLLNLGRRRWHALLTWMESN